MTGIHRGDATVVSNPSSERLLFVGADGADWHLCHEFMDAGHMPNLLGLVERGAIAGLRSLDPSVCAMHWASILSGQLAPHHGIHGAVEVDSAHGLPRRVWRDRLKAAALPSILSRYGVPSIFVGWPFSYPAEDADGICVTDLFTSPVAPRGDPWPILPGQVSPGHMAKSLTEYRVHPGEFSFADLAEFFPNTAPENGDPGVAELARVVAEAVSVHGVATALMERQPWRVCAIHYDFLNAISRTFIDYHPPRPGHIPDRDFDIYRQVVTVAYRFFDQLLGRLLELSGDDAHLVLVSDHGFHSGSLRPRSGRAGGLDQAALRHRPQGMLCMCGPNVKSDKLVYAAGPLDVLPTVLALLDLPIAEGLPGGVLRHVFRQPLKTRTVSHWGVAAIDSAASEYARFSAAPGTGYLSLQGIDKAEVVEDIGLAERYNLARAYLGANEPQEAIPILEALIESRPGDLRFQLFLAEACFAVGNHQRSGELAESILRRQDRHPRASLILARIRLGSGDSEAARQALRAAESLHEERTRHHVDVAETYLQLDDWQEAERSLRRALAIDDNDAQVMTLLCRCLTGDGRLDEAIEAGRSAIGLDFDLASAHLHLGVALLLSGEAKEGIGQIEICVSLDPGLSLAQAVLAEYHEEAGRTPQAIYHRAMIRQR